LLSAGIINFILIIITKCHSLHHSILCLEGGIQRPCYAQYIKDTTK